MKKLFVFLFTALFTLSACTDEDWEQAKNDNTLESYERYLDENPDGKFVDAANDKVDFFLTDLANWELAVKENTIISYKKYMDENPDGLNIDSAKHKIKGFEADIQADSDAWEKAQSKESFWSYNDYITWFPSGNYIDEAKEKQKKIFIELLDNQFRSVKNFIHDTEGLDYNYSAPLENDSIFYYFSNKGCKISSQEIKGELTYEKLQYNQYANNYYHICAVQEYIEKFDNHEYEIEASREDDIDEIKIVIDYYEGDISYYLELRFIYENDDCKITYLETYIDEPGC